MRLLFYNTNIHSSGFTVLGVFFGVKRDFLTF
jgi:hypothetical protein